MLVPHFGLGLGIGILDAALVPLLAAVVDSKYTIEDDSTNDGHYGAVYAIQQTAVSLAYSIGKLTNQKLIKIYFGNVFLFPAPMIGGELAQTIGFTWLMRIIGIINLIYGPILIFYSARINLQPHCDKSADILLESVEVQNKTNYKKFYNSID